MRRIKVIAVGLAALLVMGTFFTTLPDLRPAIALADTNTPSVFTNFVTRSSDKLMAGTGEFRFISANVPTLSMVEDITWRTPDAWEQEDAFKTLVQMGATATRPYVFSVRKVEDTADIQRAVMAPGVFNEDVFKAFDKMLQLANQYGVRIIVPFVDQYQWQGGIAEYAAFRNKSKDQFWTDAQLITDFKTTISYVLNRVNTYTGVAYKDDPAIMAWETGNELVPASQLWTHNIAAYIKSIDSHHLVLDGKYGIDDASLVDNSIDMVSNHYYPDHYADYALQVNLDKAKSSGLKPFIVGEFGFKPTAEVGAFLDNVIESGVSGAMIWSLRYHNRDGGFYPHTESTYGGIFYGSYRWPGFPSGNGFDETNLLQTLRTKAFQIRGINPAPPIPVPEAPILLPIEFVSTIGWKGSVGASSYIVERAEQANGAWTVVGPQVFDAVSTDTQLFDDRSAVTAQTYFYRVKAVNSAGTSVYSNVIGPVAAKHVILDEMRNYEKMYDYTTDLELDSKRAADFGGDSSRVKALNTTIAQYVEYALPIANSGSQPVQVKSVHLESYIDKTKPLTSFVMEATTDGITYTPVVASVTDTAGIWLKRVYQTGALAVGTKTIRLRYPTDLAAGQLGRLQIEYQTDGGALTFPEPIHRQIISDGLLTDDFNNFIKMDTHSANLGFFSDNEVYFGGDMKRLGRTSNANESFIYKTGGDMNYFQFVMYARQNPNDYVLPDFKFYTSIDGSSYLPYSDTSKKSTPGDGYWTKTEYTAFKLPAGVRYLKLEFPVVPIAFADQTWNPQASQLQIGVGSLKLDPPPGSAQSAWIDDYESYSGSNANLRAAYMLNQDGSAVTLSLNSANKSSGNYGMKLETNLELGWGGMEKNVSGANWSGNTGIELWVNPGGADVGISIQFTESVDTAGEVWKAARRISGNTPVLIKIPFSEFTIPDWWLNSHPTVGNRKPDLNTPVSFGLYLDGAAGAKTMYMDAIKLYRDPTIDRFETYDGDNAKLRAAYTRNTSGDDITLTLDTRKKNDGSYGLMIDYNLTDAKGFAGVTKDLHSINWLGMNGIRLWVKPDRKNQDLTLQIRETGSEYWEAKLQLSGKDDQLIEIPFHAFHKPAWAPQDNGKLDLASVSEFSIYVDKGSKNKGKGTIYVDSIEAATIGAIDNFETYQGSNTAVAGDYVRNSSGDPVSVTLDAKHNNEGNYSLKLAYSLTNTLGYAGVTKQLGLMDWKSAGYNALQFWIEPPDKTGHVFTLQFKEADGDQWEAQVSMDGKSKKPLLIQVPFSGFGRSLWSTGDGKLDLTSVTEYSLYVNKKNGVSGSFVLYIDEVKLAKIAVLDNFDFYDGDSELVAAKAYTPNPFGGSIIMRPQTEFKQDGKYGLKYDYELPSNSTNFAGATKTLGSMSWEGYKGLNLWLKPDGSNRKLVIQFKEADGETWEQYVQLTGKTAKNLSFNFSGFVHAPWNTAGNGTLDLGSISEYSLYVNQDLGTIGKGTLYFDEIALFKNKP
ncbi:hypothetical protein EHS13_27465 [Paenibacillus psychroresistens]|uniref:mannan endo-1,4-beta-mannosidase n=1 Tax=Paenibacillus psychroresistens TaxID=1778678 RepID=A0A6B8RR76_9BACL|nr:CIA30 family protein [Paenibacillus psychroresistens]QGQ98357.1 hypothetical protein EHS13_27465 [Paenibacillus psychroresistens]